MCPASIHPRNPPRHSSVVVSRRCPNSLHLKIEETRLNESVPYLVVCALSSPPKPVACIRRTLLQRPGALLTFTLHELNERTATATTALSSRSYPITLINNSFSFWGSSAQPNWVVSMRERWRWMGRSVTKWVSPIHPSSHLIHLTHLIHPLISSHASSQPVSSCLACWMNLN